MSFETPLPPFNASDPHARFLSATALDLLLIEIVPMARRLSSPFSSTTSAEVAPGAAEEVEAEVEEEEREEEEREAMFYRLEQLGFKVGQGLVERFLPSPSLFPLFSLRLLGD